MSTSNPSPARRSNVKAPQDSLIPRHTDIQQLNTLLDTKHQICILGFPGTGKSSLAQFIAHDDLRYPVALWYTFGPNVHQRSVDIYTAWICCLLECDTLPDGVIPDARTFHDELSKYPRRIIVCDDVHDDLMLDEITSALPPGTHIIVTTRIAQVSRRIGYDIYMLGGMSITEAQFFLAQQLVVPHDDVCEWAWVDSMHAAVEGHPLALALIAQRLRLHSNQPEMWESFVEAILTGVIQRAFSDFTDHPVIAAGFMPLLSYNYDLLNPLEKQILHTMAVCDPDHPVSLRLLMAMWQLNEIQMSSVMHRLSEHLFVIPHTHGWKQHTIMHSYTYMLVNQQQSQHYLQIQLTNALITLLNTDDTYRTYTKFNNEYNQCLTVIDYLLKHNLPKAVELVRALCMYLAEKGEYYNAHELTQQLLRRTENDSESPLHISALDLCAMISLNCAVHIGQHRDDYLHQGFACLRDVKNHQEHIDDVVSASVLMKIGIILIEIASLPGQDMLSGIDASLANYERALRAPGLDAELYVSLCQNRANAYMMRAEYNYPDCHDDCRKAIDVCIEGIQWVPTQSSAQLIAGLYSTLSSAYHFYADLPEVTSSTYLDLAKTAAHDAMLLVDDTEQPQRYAQMLMNYANLCSNMSTQPDVNQQEYANEALESFAAALEYRTEATVPMEYAWTQHNRADALRIAANITDQQTITHFQEAWDAIHESLRIRTPQENPSHYALSHYVRAHLAIDYALATYHSDEDLARTIVQAGLQSYSVIDDLQTKHELSPALILGITDYTSMLLGLHAWLNPDTAWMDIDRAFTLNNTVRDGYPGNASDDQAEVMAHRLQLHRWAWMLRITIADVQHDIAQAEALCLQPLRPLIACQLHLQLAVIYQDMFSTETNNSAFHATQARALARRLSYAPVARMLAE